MFEQKKFTFFLPNIFTAINLGCGFFAILQVVQGNFYKACTFIAVGVIFDLFDGRIARLTGTQSAFGEQFDSLSDLVSFGMAPSLIFYFRFLSDLNRLGMVLAFLFMLCGALRLARFNANIKKISSEFFQGLPIPVSALALIGYVMLSLELELITALTPLNIAFILFFSLLMISNIPFYSFKKNAMVMKNKKLVLMILLLAILAIVTYEEVMLFALIISYVVFSIAYFAKNYSRFKQIDLFGEVDEEQVEASEEK